MSDPKPAFAVVEMTSDARHTSLLATGFDLHRQHAMEHHFAQVRCRQTSARREVLWWNREEKGLFWGLAGANLAPLG
jgi:hypothetical protein